MEVQWAERENLEESLERRRREGSSLLAEVMQKVPELLVHERTSQGKGVKCTKEKKIVKGWSTVEMKGKPSSSLEEDTEEMRKWRGMSQGEMNQCWKNLAERMEVEVLEKYKVDDSKIKASQRQRLPAGMEACVQKRKKYKIGRWREGWLLGKNLRFVQRVEKS